MTKEELKQQLATERAEAQRRVEKAEGELILEQGRNKVITDENERLRKDAAFSKATNTILLDTITRLVKGE